MANNLDNIETIVLVMMENRSFDHMLGHLTIDDPNLPVEGLKMASMADYSNDYRNTLYSVYKIETDQELEADVPHEYSDVATQLQQNPVTGQFTMHGFVEAYANAGHLPNDECIPMGYFPSSLVPITDFFSKNFCTCDHWFAPIPTSTQPNRTMAFCGDTEIFKTHFQLIPIGVNLFDWMVDHGINWRVYHDGFSFFALYNHLWGYVLGPNFKRFNTFHADQLLPPQNDDPQVIIIEPCYEDAPHVGQQPNDNHAPLAVGWGEDFLRQVYLAATANPERWKHTVMILYYDEHGGFFDHVQPLSIPYTTTGNPSHAFNCTGPRIPAHIISPFVQKGSVFPKNLDHTSVLQFLTEKFTPGQSFSPNVDQRKAAGIHSISECLNDMPPQPAPDPPSQKIYTKTALGKYIPTENPTPMEQSFANAANELLQHDPGRTAEKFPEVVAWKDIQSSNNKRD